LIDTRPGAPVISERIVGLRNSPSGPIFEAIHAVPDSIELHVNGEPRSAAAECTVHELLTSLGLNDRRIAVAINRGVVPRSTFDSTRLSAGDRVEILEAVGGG
jgi:thiamine biosynthesis protein ThiS